MNVWESQIEQGLLGDRENLLRMAAFKARRELRPGVMFSGCSRTSCFACRSSGCGPGL